MVEKLASTMYVFGIVFLIAAIVAAGAAFFSAMSMESDAAAMAKSLFRSCLGFAMLLWVIVWLIG